MSQFQIFAHMWHKSDPDYWPLKVEDANTCSVHVALDVIGHSVTVQKSASIDRTAQILTVRSLPKDPLAESPYGPSESDPSPSSTSCQDIKEGGSESCFTVLKALSLVCVRACTAPVCLAGVSSAPLSSQSSVYER